MISAKRVLTARLRRTVLILTLVAIPAAVLPAGAGAAAPGPAWTISASIFAPTNFAPGDASGSHVYNIEVINSGSKPSNGQPITITDFLPPGLTLNPDPINPIINFVSFNDGELFSPCGAGPPATCTFTGEIVRPGMKLYMRVPVNIDPGAPPTVTNAVSVSGGGAESASTSVQTTISATPAPFGVQSVFTSPTDAGGAPETRAGAHPYQIRAGAQFNTIPGGNPTENPKSLTVDLPAGMVLNPEATPARCEEAELESFPNRCPSGSAVGVSHITINLGTFTLTGAVTTQPLYNMVPPQGRPAELGFNTFGLAIHLMGKVRSDGDYGLSSETLDVPQFVNMSGVSVELWGDPSDPSHDYRRGNCGYSGDFGLTCPAAQLKKALLTMPTACSGPLTTKLSANSWQNPGTFVSKTAQTLDSFGNPVGVSGCETLSYSPATETAMSTAQAETGSGLDFNVDFPNNGLEDIAARSEAMTEKAIVTLPQGITINPSVGEGLGFCTPAQYDKEATFSVDGEGCPSDSKVGSLHLTTPLVNEGIDGSVYLAQQDDPTTSTPGAENPFNTDIALYMVLRNTQLGVMVKQALKVIPDPKTGQLVATLEDIPQLPFSHFNFHFREGARAALISPSACGKYTTVAKFYSSSDPSNPKTANSSFEITKGVGGGPCPSGGVPPFAPDFQAGAINNSAGAFSPFNMRLLRKDGDQDMTKFSSILPPGQLGSLAGVSKCPDAAIAIAKSKTGRQEKESPSCPANSLIGRTYAGAGVGDSLTYVPGNLYLGGPYNGDPLSVISITPGLAGPFDAGTVVVRLALNLNSKTAEVEVDGANSDPIPHILKGIVLKVRDLRVYVDRPNFTLNPTSCDPSSVKATLFGSFLDVFSPTDDVPAGLSTRYQAADCQSLRYKPGLTLQLKGGTRRGGHPGLLATYKARKGDANTKGIVVRLPRSAFLDQAHIRTICTRVQFAADNCPKGAQYGYIKAFTPLLDEPLQGPVWLRSSNHKLPDLVFDLKGLVDVEVATRIDSARGGIRASIESAPDAPLNKVELRMQGGKKGLIINSRNLCGKISRANVEFTGQNGKESKLNPVMQAECGGKRKGKRHRG